MLVTDDGDTDKLSPTLSRQHQVVLNITSLNFGTEIYENFKHFLEKFPEFSFFVLNHLMPDENLQFRQILVLVH